MNRQMPKNMPRDATGATSAPRVCMVPLVVLSVACTSKKVTTNASKGKQEERGQPHCENRQAVQRKARYHDHLAAVAVHEIYR